MSRKKQEYPSKVTLNLVINERPKNYNRNIIVTLVAIVLLLGAFTKFAVIDVLSAANELKQTAADKQTRYEQLLSDNEVYAAVSAEYAKYFTIVSTAEDYPDCKDVIDIIDTNLFPKAVVQSVTYDDNIVLVTLANIGLDQASDIIRALNSEENSAIIASATMPTLDTTVGNVYSSLSMEITLVAPPEAEETVDADQEDAE